jgi:hypothetical protein
LLGKRKSGFGPRPGRQKIKKKSGRGLRWAGRNQAEKESLFAKEKADL